VPLFARVVPKVVIDSASERPGSFRFEQRLHRPEEFAAVMAARQVVRGRCFDLHFRSGGSGLRLGLIVPKRLARAASLRNAIKRQGREAFRLLAADLPPFELVLRLSRAIKGVRASDCEQKVVWRLEIETLLRRLCSQTR
jgi:ribonuclease P protein component